MTSTMSASPRSEPASTAPVNQPPRVLSGIQPTADSFQVGNYLGAIRRWVDLQETHDAFYCVVDQHAITVEYDPQVLRQRTLLSFAQLMAAGLDPQRATIFVQSHVPEHSQLSWVLQCMTGFGEAGRMTQFKDKSAREGTDRSTVGLFTYPVLQAADILIYQANGVPVGEDQRQHLELTRDLAQRFNSRFGDTFVVPEALIVADTAKILDLADPSSKMSKSSPSGCLFLLDDERVLTKKIKTAVTDSGREISLDRESKPGVSNLLSLIGAFTDRTPDQVATDLQGGGYGDLKAAAIDAVLSFTGPFAAAVAELMADPGELTRLMNLGAHRARDAAAPTLAAVYDRVGFVQLPD